MASTKTKARILMVGEIEKNPFLALSTNEKDVEKFARVAKTYGNVSPAIVGQSGNTYRVLSGQTSLEACAHSGIQEIPVVVAEVSDEAEQMKLALLLSTVREESGALSEGAFIDALLTRHGISRQELMNLLKKSKSWISKRQSLAVRLSETVKGMVKDGVICARSAEEVAKLPEDVQVMFVSKIIRDGLSKTDVGQLVSKYTREDADSALREAILESPLVVLDTCPVRTVSRRKEKRGLPERIAGNAGFLIRLLMELKGLLAQADTRCLKLNATHLNGLYAALTDLKTVLDGISSSCFPGETSRG
jgi:ParB family chromosome partitioning protein